jgi:hypothetical protein
MTKTLTIEMDRGQGREVRAEEQIPPDATVARIEADLRAYAIQYPHRALVNGVEVAHVGQSGSFDSARGAK